MNPEQKPAPDSARLFLALLPDDNVKAALALHRAQWHWPPGAARYAPDDWHVTLHFLGSVVRQRIAPLRAGLVVPMTPFELRFGQPQLWPHGLAVLSPETVPAGLQQLHERLAQALQRLGQPTDARPYRPHITLARHAPGAVAPRPWPRFDWQVQGYALMASTGQASQRYRVLQQYRSAP